MVWGGDLQEEDPLFFPIACLFLMWYTYGILPFLLSSGHLSWLKWQSFPIFGTKYIKLKFSFIFPKNITEKKLNNACPCESFFSIPKNNTFPVFWVTLHWYKNCILYYNKERFSRPFRSTLFKNPNNWGVGRTRFCGGMLKRRVLWKWVEAVWLKTQTIFAPCTSVFFIHLIV